MRLSIGAALVALVVNVPAVAHAAAPGPVTPTPAKIPRSCRGATKPPGTPLKSASAAGARDFSELAR